MSNAADGEALVAKLQAERAAAVEKLQATKVVPIALLQRLANPANPYPKKSPLVGKSIPIEADRLNAEANYEAWKTANGAKPNAEPSPKKQQKATEPGPKTDGDVEEALKAEAPVAVSDLGPEEEKRRRITRWMKLKEINRKCAVIRSFGGKCVIVTEGQSRHDPNKKVFDFQFKEAFEAWLANDFVPSLEKKNKNDAVGRWWWRHPKRRQYDGAVFKPLASPVVQTSDGQLLLNTYLGWGVEPRQGDWSLLRSHIRDVLANGDTKADDYIIRWIAWSIQHPSRRSTGLDRRKRNRQRNIR